MFLPHLKSEPAMGEFILAVAQGVLHEDDDHEEEFEIDINEAEPEFLKGQSSRSGVEVILDPKTQTLAYPCSP